MIEIKNRFTGKVIKAVDAENLLNADLSYADLSYADLRGVQYNEYTAFFAMQCPEEGAFVAWKKVEGMLVKLLIPEDAARSSSTSRMCRASKAVVLDITDIAGNAIVEVVNTNYTPHITYRVGEEVLPDSWDGNRWNECSHGIHFFITKEEAIQY